MLHSRTLNVSTTALLLLALYPALAAAKDKQAPRQVGTVMACSKYGGKCITARVRTTKLGPQYLSPGGTWTWCEERCEDTLRRHTVDFWHDQRERSSDR